MTTPPLLIEPNGPVARLRLNRPELYNAFDAGLIAELTAALDALAMHLNPYLPAGFPPYSLGARKPRTRVGAAFWRGAERVTRQGLERGRSEHNACRARLGLGPLPWVHTGLSRELTLVATLPHLEYPRVWPAWLRVTGPLLWEPPGERVAPPPGDGPVVLVAPSTSQDREHSLLQAALNGLADVPVRVIAIFSGDDPPVTVPDNAVLVPWLSYSRTMPECDLVVCHGGHGTLARALVSGRPVVVCPAGGDMAENGARVEWAGLGVRLPRRLCTPRGVRLAVARALSRRGVRERAEAVARWAAVNNAGERATRELERWWARRAPTRSRA